MNQNSQSVLFASNFSEKQIFFNRFLFFISSQLYFKPERSSTKSTSILLLFSHRYILNTVLLAYSCKIIFVKLALKFMYILKTSFNTLKLMKNYRLVIDIQPNTLNRLKVL